MNLNHKDEKNHCLWLSMRRSMTLVATFFSLTIMSSVDAANRQWNQLSGGTYNLNLTGNWTGGQPGNGDNAYLTFTGTGNNAIIVTNATANIFTADSLFVTNTTTSSGRTISVLLRGQTFLTNGAGALVFGGATGTGRLTLNFSNNVTAKTILFDGGSSAGAGSTLSFAGGTLRADTLTFLGGGVRNASNSLRFTSVTMLLASNMSVSGGDLTNQTLMANSTLTVGGSLSVAGNRTDQYFVITNSLLTVTNGLLNTGRIDLRNLGTLNVVSDWTNNGVLNFATGITTLRGGILTNQSNGVLLGTGVIVAPLVNQGSMNWSGVISNSFLQTQGTNLLSGATTITGAATVSGGILNLNGQTMSNGLLTISGAGVLTSSVANAILRGGLINAGKVYLTNNITFTGPVSNSAAFTWQGTLNNNFTQTGGTNLLAGNSTITGSATIDGGLVNLNGKNANFGALNGGGGTLLNNGNGLSTLTVTNGGSFGGTIADRTSGSGTLTLTVTGGALTLSGTNSYTGATTINGGTLRAANNTALGTVAGGVTVASGAALELIGGIAVGAEALSLNGTGIGGAGALRNISGSNSWAGALTLANVTGVHRINSDADLLTISGNIGETGLNNNKDLTFGGAGNITVTGDITASGGDMRLFKDGAGTLVLAGDNTYDGLTTISGGTLSISSSGNLGSGSLTFANGATLRTTGATVVDLGTRAITLSAGGGNLDLGVPLYSSGAISGGGGLTTGGSDLILNRPSGNNTIGTITVTSGRLFVFTLNSINASPIIVQSGAILDFTVAGGAAPANLLTFASGAGVANRLGILTLTTNTVSFPTAGSFIFNSDDQPTTNILINSAYPALTGDLTFQVGGGTNIVGLVTLNGAITGNGGLTKTEIGTLRFDGSAANTYSGLTTVNGGRLELNKSGTANAISSGGLTINTGATVKYTGASTDMIANSAGVVVNGGTLDISANNDTVAGVQLISGTITGGVGRLTSTSDFDVQAGTVAVTLGGNVGLTKTTAGTVVLNGWQQYTGPTLIQGGILTLGPSAVVTNTSYFNVSAGATFNVTALSGGLTLAPNQTLSGNGTVLGNVTIGNGATLSPGNSIGTLTYTANLTLAANATTVMELNTALPASNDLVQVTGILTYGGTLNVVNIGGVLVAGDTFKLFEFGTQNGSFASLILPGLNPGLAWDTTQLLEFGQLTVIPEPSAFVLVGCGLVLLTVVRRYRKFGASKNRF
ncbi:MAG: hypothetical protein PCFJNLEI_00694 [Verrucomicrobiae bacterium]|nr:hypothetical protein [Verrucomicrobiae bacterium]